jgi:hypothetical protein
MTVQKPGTQGLASYRVVCEIGINFSRENIWQSFFIIIGSLHPGGNEEHTVVFFHQGFGYKPGPIIQSIVFFLVFKRKRGNAYDQYTRHVSILKKAKSPLFNAQISPILSSFEKRGKKDNWKCLL